jgi:hypothetical protein
MAPHPRRDSNDDPVIRGSDRSNQQLSRRISAAFERHTFYVAASRTARRSRPIDLRAAFHNMLKKAELERRSTLLAIIGPFFGDEEGAGSPHRRLPK